MEDIAADFRAGLADLQWVVGVYPLVFAALLLPAGSLSDRLGRREVFLAGVAGFTLASGLCGIAGSPEMLMAARAIQGIGGAVTFAPAIPLLVSAFPAERRASAIGVFSAVGAASAALGPLAGGALVEVFGWRSIFLVNLLPGVILLAGALLRITAPPRESWGGPLDLPGAALAAVALFAINYAVVAGADHGWRSADVAVAACAGLAGLAAFVLVERRAAQPLLDLRLFRIASFAGAAALSFLTRVLHLGPLAYLVLWLQGMLGYSPLETGIRLVALSAAVIVTSLAAGRLLGRTGPAALVTAGFVVIALGFVFLAQVGAETPWTVALPGLVLLGAGSGLLYAPLMTVSVSGVPPARAGMASGLVNAFFPLGTAIGVTVFGALLSAQVGAALADERLRTAVEAGRFAEVPATSLAAARTAFADGIAAIGLAGAALALVGALTAAATLRRRASPATPPVPAEEKADGRHGR
ncbi:hypothetical protein GCM10023259_006850 [Thermocatellispora tengchongensis]